MFMCMEIHMAYMGMYMYMAYMGKAEKGACGWA